MFSSHDPKFWHENGVLLSPPEPEHVRSPKRDSSWKALMMLAVYPVVVAPIYALPHQYGGWTRVTFARDAFEYTGNPRSNPDVLPADYWSRFEKRWKRMRPVKNDGKEDPEPPF